MDDKETPSARKETASKRRWGVALSFLINLPLLFILAGPWIWAYFSSAHVDEPGHYIEDTFRSVRARELASWHQLKGDEDHENDAPIHKNLNVALDRVEAALKKPILDRAEIQQALDDLTAARKEVGHEMSGLIKHNPPSPASQSAPSNP